MRLSIIVAGVLCAAMLTLLAPTADAVNKVDVFIYTDTTQWIDQGSAKKEAEILAEEIDGKNGIGESHPSRSRERSRSVDERSCR